VSTREVLIVLAHARMCERCKERLLDDPTSVTRGRALTEEEKTLFGNLAAMDFTSAERLAEAVGCDPAELTEYLNHPVARLRHF
jgi:hypothetical protein